MRRRSRRRKVACFDEWFFGAWVMALGMALGVEFFLLVSLYDTRPCNTVMLIYDLLVFYAWFC